MERTPVTQLAALTDEAARWPQADLRQIVYDLVNLKWLRSDPAAALAAVQSADLTDAQRTYLLQAIARQSNPPVTSIISTKYGGNWGGALNFNNSPHPARAGSF